jgi:hypothetical protein
MPPPKPSPAPPVDGICERLAKAVERSDYGLFPGDRFSLDGSCFGWDMVDEGSINSSCGSSIFSFSRLGLSSGSFFGFMPARVGEGRRRRHFFDDQHRYHSAALLEGRSSPDNAVAVGFVHLLASRGDAHLLRPAPAKPSGQASLDVLPVLAAFGPELVLKESAFTRADTASRHLCARQGGKCPPDR